MGSVGVVGSETGEERGLTERLGKLICAGGQAGAFRLPRSQKWSDTYILSLPRIAHHPSKSWQGFASDTAQPKQFHHHDESEIHRRHSHPEPINPEADGSGGLPAVTIGSEFITSAQPPLFTHDNEEHTWRE